MFGLRVVNAEAGGRVYPVVCCVQQGPTGPQVLHTFSLTGEIGVWSLTCTSHVANTVGMSTLIIVCTKLTHSTILREMRLFDKKKMIH